jgi:hypothetical protein
MWDKNKVSVMRNIKENKLTSIKKFNDWSKGFNQTEEVVESTTEEVKETEEVTNESKSCDCIDCDCKGDCKNCECKCCK